MHVLRSLGYGRLAVLAATTLALVGFFAFVTQRLIQSPMALLFGNLSIEEAGQIINRLEAARVTYRLGANGTQIFVAEDQALRWRMQLAETGLPTGGSVGYEIFDQGEALGASSFVQNVNLLRALEGELARTIRTIERVQSARVHLVLPKREVFSREQREPSASIVLKLRGARLDPGQVRAIQNLVAAAVPDLRPSRVAIVDDRGAMLAKGSEDRDSPAAATGNLMEVRAAHEDRLKRAIEALLERSVGVGNVRAEVTADIDFDRITTSSESFDPDGQVIRSTQTVTEENRSTEGQAQTVTVANNLPDRPGSDAGGQTSANTQRTEEVVNYEISKTQRTQVREAGLIRRVSVAVLVNAATTVDPQGKKTVAPRPEEELKHYATLVRSTIGFDAKRGDVVDVQSLPFADVEEIAPTIETPGLFGFTKTDVMRFTEVVALGLISVLAMLFVVRPVVARLAAVIRSIPTTPLPAIGQHAALPGPAVGDAISAPLVAEAAALQVQRPAIDSMIDLARVEGQVKASSVKKIGEIIEKHPEEAAAIVRNWLLQGT